MADFPSLAPDEISYDLGQQNISEAPTIGGGPIRFRHSLLVNGYLLRLVFNNLTQSQVDLIRAHFVQSAGTHSYFKVPSTIWGTAQVVTTDSLYRYASQPEEAQKGVYFDVQVELRVLNGNIILFDLYGGGATQPAATAFTSFAFTGYQPFILNGGTANPASPAATHYIEGGGASR